LRRGKKISEPKGNKIFWRETFEGLTLVRIYNMNDITALDYGIKTGTLSALDFLGIIILRIIGIKFCRSDPGTPHETQSKTAPGIDNQIELALPR
jgi:hypothetical protein